MIAEYNIELALQRQMFFVEGALTYEFDRPFSWRVGGESWQWCRPYAWVCPRCLRTWAYAPIRGREGEAFEINAAPCGKCGGGSLITFWVSSPRDPALLDYAPLELLTREFNLALAIKEET